MHQREPSVAADTKELEIIGERLSAQRLVQKTRRIIIEKTTKDFGIQVTDAEINLKWKQLTNGVNIKQVSNTQQNIVIPRINAIKAVYEDGEDQNVVYDKMLKGVLTKKEWEIDLYYYSKPERRKLLVQLTNQTPEEMLKPQPGILALVENDKLNAVIDSTIARTNTQFAEYLKLAAVTNQVEIDQKYPPRFLSIKRNEWWIQQFNKTPVVFYADRYKKIWHDWLDKERKINSTQ